MTFLVYFWRDLYLSWSGAGLVGELPPVHQVTAVLAGPELDRGTCLDLLSLQSLRLQHRGRANYLLLVPLRLFCRPWLLSKTAPFIRTAPFSEEDGWRGKREEGTMTTICFRPPSLTANPLGKEEGGGGNSATPPARRRTSHRRGTPWQRLSRLRHGSEPL